MKTQLVALLIAGLGTVDARLVGFHVDDESCSGLLQNNKTDQIIKCAKFFSSLSNLSATLANQSAALRKQGAGEWAELKLAVDAGTAWSCPAGASGCFNLTFNGETKSVAQHVVDLADETVIMDYDRSPQNLYSRAKAYLEYADSQDAKLGKQISIGVAISSWGDKHPAGWQTRSEAEMEKLMDDALGQLKTHRSFKGFAVFTQDSWHSQSSHALTTAAATTRTTFHAAGAWYIDHKMALNETTRVDWLTWADSRNITALYIAPHAGSTALISIPGIEGSAANDKKFCDFIHLADKQGIDIGLLSTPVTDWHFVQNCSARRHSSGESNSPLLSAGL